MSNAQKGGIPVIGKSPVRLRPAVFLGVMLCITSQAVWADQDVVMVLDTSSLMHPNSAAITQAMADFANSRGPDTRIAFITYDKSASLRLALTPISDAIRRQIAGVLSHLDYRSRSSDTTAGLEQGLSEIINHGSGNSQKSLVLITDDFVNSGNAGDAKDKVSWIMQSLVPTAIYNHTRIFAVTFTPGSVYKALQQLTEATGGGAFRVENDAGLTRVFQRINANMMSIGPTSMPISPGQAAQLSLPSGIVGPVIPSQFNTPLTHQNIKSARIRWLWLIGLLALIAASFGIYAGWNIMRHIRIPRKVVKPLLQYGEGPRAVLYDISNPNDIKRFELAERSTLLGRVAGYDPEVQYVLVKEKTVGRCHAVIERRGHSFWIMDQGSINGTFVNGERITTDRALKHGDIVAIHRHEFEFMIPEYFESESTVVGAREQLTG
jgi:hypothetical protein